MVAQAPTGAGCLDPGFLLIFKALKDGIKPQPKKMTAQDVIRLMGLARTMQKKINGEG